MDLRAGLDVLEKIKTCPSQNSNPASFSPYLSLGMPDIYRKKRWHIPLIDHEKEGISA
jgi:hypothetical protein